MQVNHLADVLLHLLDCKSKVPRVRYFRRSNCSSQCGGHGRLVVLHEGGLQSVETFQMAFKSAVLMISWTKAIHGLCHRSFRSQDGGVLAHRHP